MFERLRRIGRRVTPASVHYECRDCGTTVERQRSGCPSCNSTEIARYHL